MNSKDYLFAPPPSAPLGSAGESERDRRLRLRAEERARKLAGNENSVYEGNLEPSKRDLIWEEKKMQRLGTQNDPKPGIPESFSTNLNQPRPASESLENVSNNVYYPQYPARFENFMQPEPVYSTKEVEKSAVMHEFRPASLQMADERRARPEYMGNEAGSFSRDVNITRDQQQYAENLFTELMKKQEPDVSKKKAYADELKRQIEEKNSRKAVEVNETGFEIGNRARGMDKKQYAAELEAQIMSRNNDSLNKVKKVQDFEEQGIFGRQPRNDNEKKMRYAQELEEQIRQKKQVNQLPKAGEEYFPFQGQDVSRDKKRMYAQELEAQIREKSRKNNEPPQRTNLYEGNRNESSRPAVNEINRNEALRSPVMDFNRNEGFRPPVAEFNRNEGFRAPGADFNRNEGFRAPGVELYRNEGFRAPVNEMNRIEDYRQPMNEYRNEGFKPLSNDYDEYYKEPAYKPDPSLPLATEASSVSYGRKAEDVLTLNPADIEKKNKYRQELERQIEEQKRRKEEEKKRIKLEEEKAEKRFFNEAGVDANKPIIRVKTVDPNKPSEENPQAERYKELLRAKQTKPEALKEEDYSKHVPNPPSTRSERVLEPQPPSYPVYSEPARPQYNEFSNPYVQPSAYIPPQNDYPAAYQVEPRPFYEEKQLRNAGSAIVDRQEIKRNDPSFANNQVIEMYLREIQETRLERDRAREQCLEMREMMLKEREKNLEQLLYMVKNPSGDSRPVSYQEARPISMEPRSQLYGFKNPETPSQEPLRNPYPEPAPYSEHFKPYQDPYKDPYKDPFKDQYKDPYKDPNKDPYKDLYKDPYQDPYKDPLNYPREPLIDYSPPKSHEPDPFEKSLIGNSKWVDPTAQWGNVKILDSAQVEFQDPDSKPRKKWQQEDQNYDTFQDSKPSTQTPRFSLHNKLQLAQVYVDDESLPSKIEHIAIAPEKASEEENVSIEDNSIREEIESESDQAYSTDERANEDRSVEQTREVVLSTPKYEEIEEHVIDCDEWSESQSEAEVDIRNRQVKNSYDRPKILNVFKEKPINRGGSVEKTRGSPEKPSAAKDPVNARLNSAGIARKEPEQPGKPLSRLVPPEKSETESLKSNPSQNRIAFSRLEEARKHAKQLKAKEAPDDIEVSQSNHLNLQFSDRPAQKLNEIIENLEVLQSKNVEDSQKLSNKSSFEGIFTSKAVNELRGKKKIATEVSSSKNSAVVNMGGFNNKFFGYSGDLDEDEKKNNPKAVPGRSQSRRYEE